MNGTTFSIHAQNNVSPKVFWNSISTELDSDNRAPMEAVEPISHETPVGTPRLLYS